MFTGIVEEVGAVVSRESREDGARLRVSAKTVLEGTGHGDSIAVNGVCLTVVEFTEDSFTVDVVAETLRRSSLRAAEVGAEVNLERAMALGDRLGGHIVQGHVDGTATVLDSRPDGLTTFALPGRLSRYMVEKGSITVDGVSLTVVEVTDDQFGVALIPTTKDMTTLGRRVAGDEVNIEVDVLAKHLEKLAAAQLADLAGVPTHAEDNDGARGGK